MKPYPYTRRYNDRGKVRIEYRRYGRNIALDGRQLSVLSGVDRTSRKDRHDSRF